MAQIICALLIALPFFGADLPTQAIYGLKALSPPLDAITLRDLAYIGVEYIFDTPIEHSHQTSLRGGRGLILLTDFDQNEAVLQKWIELASILPKEIIQSPEGSHNLVELQLRSTSDQDLVIILNGKVTEELKFFNEWVDKILHSL